MPGIVADASGATGLVCSGCQEYKTGEDLYVDSRGCFRTVCRDCTSDKGQRYFRSTYTAKAREVIAGGEAEGRTCTSCRSWKAASEFYINSFGNLNSTCMECTRQWSKEKYHQEYKNDPQYRWRMSENARRWRMDIREDVIAAYGGRCSCCGESEPEFLTLDHVNNDGAEHRRANALSTGIKAWKWARDNQHPQNLQLLCWNCNCAKGIYGSCPHQDQQEAERPVVLVPDRAAVLGDYRGG